MNLTFDKTNDIIDVVLDSGANLRLTFEESAEFARRLIHFLKDGRDAPPTNVLRSGMISGRPNLPPIPQEVRNIVVNPFIGVLDEQLLPNESNPTGS